MRLIFVHKISGAAPAASDNDSYWDGTDLYIDNAANQYVDDPIEVYEDDAADTYWDGTDQYEDSTAGA